MLVLLQCSPPPPYYAQRVVVQLAETQLDDIHLAP